MTTAPLPCPSPELSGWEGRAAAWVRRGVLALALAVGGLWGATSVAPALTSPGALLGAVASHQHRQRRQEDGIDCADCVDCIDCGADCGGCGDCADCGGCGDCGGLDCGGIDCACATAVRPQAAVGAACRRGAPWGSAAMLLAPLLIFAAWRRIPERRQMISK
jgi:hypothetical protein